MADYKLHKEQLEINGYSITKPLISESTLVNLKKIVYREEKSYAIRQLVNKQPEILEVLFKEKSFRELYAKVCGKGYFLTKAIYFNKPAMSNWFVGYHQDLSISAKEKQITKDYVQWTYKEKQWGVIPPEGILKNTITFRVHLDSTDETNGALHVIPKSHVKGIIRIDEHFKKEALGKEVLCNVEKGAVMLMNPLVLHASQRSVSASDRSVIHLEFCNQEIPMGWLERKSVENDKIF
ncbi:phytanoyl-CoA dioxygenase family protein [Tenacibaculum amylolyticum]|uniref:phytanoyl-CoA dioxygenase family protein n=1 Tax=Tenacibaculum amylolyticum TaxID=104269 RepID=UPI003893379B